MGRVVCECAARHWVSWHAHRSAPAICSFDMQAIDAVIHNTNDVIFQEGRSALSPLFGGHTCARTYAGSLLHSPHSLLQRPPSTTNVHRPYLRLGPSSAEIGLRVHLHIPFACIICDNYRGVWCSLFFRDSLSGLTNTRVPHFSCSRAAA